MLIAIFVKQTEVQEVRCILATVRYVTNTQNYVADVNAMSHV